MSDAVNPRHYKAHASGIEAIDIVEHLDFCLGNAVKYIWRAGLKPGQLQLSAGDDVQDLSKSAWYLARAVGKLHFIAKGTNMPITNVIASEPAGSVLRDVLELLVQKMLIGDQPRVADALVRVEREIADRTARE